MFLGSTGLTATTGSWGEFRDLYSWFATSPQSAGANGSGTDTSTAALELPVDAPAVDRPLAPKDPMLSKQARKRVVSPRIELLIRSSHRRRRTGWRARPAFPPAIPGVFILASSRLEPPPT